MGIQSQVKDSKGSDPREYQVAFPGEVQKDGKDFLWSECHFDSVCKNSQPQLPPPDDDSG